MSQDDDTLLGDAGPDTAPPRPKASGTKSYGINGWDGSRRSWTGDPDNGSSIEVISDEPFQALITPPRHWYESDPEPEKVGYGKPPRQHRFQPGQSGNPKGRPMGSKNKPKPVPIDDRFAAIVLQEYYREVSVTLGGEQVTLPIAQIGMRAVMARAAKGHVAAMRFAAELTGRIEAQRAHDQLTNFQELATLKADLQREIESRRRQGNTDISDIWPHPDHIHIDVRRVTAEIKGPMTPEENVAWDQHMEWVAFMEDGIAQLRAGLEEEADPKARRWREKIIKDIEAKVKETREQMPDWTSRPD